jgi:hypothetical protein
VTCQVRALFRRGNRRTLLSAEGKARRRELLKAYCGVEATSHVVLTAYHRGDDQAARERCLDVILARSPSGA